MTSSQLPTEPSRTPRPDPHRWTLVAAIASNRVIGRGDTLPWKMSSDLKRFKRLTMGHCLLMGRKTYQSIGRPLPGRQTIVLSRSGFDPGATSVQVVDDLGAVEQAVEPDRCIMVVGGAELYAASLPRCHTLWITRILTEVAGDTYFPEIDWQPWRLTHQEVSAAQPGDDWPSEFQIWQRVQQSP